MSEPNPPRIREHGLSNPLSTVGGCAVPAAALFLVVVAVLLNAPALFYMATALIVLLGACHLQARYAVRALRFERVAPESARIGELVTIEIVVWSERKIRRPLVTVRDHLPGKLPLTSRSSSLPIAPAYDIPVRTLYQFRAMRRGKYTWHELTVEGTDALGLIHKQRLYRTAPSEMIVLPRPIPVAMELPAAAGFGLSEAESGSTRGAGLEPFGVREYVAGDSLRHVHWRSSAKVGTLLVKEFETGSHSVATFVLQTTRGTDLGSGSQSSLDLICGHAVYLAETFIRQGMRVEFPGLDRKGGSNVGAERIAEIYDLLAQVEAQDLTPVGERFAALAPDLGTGSVVFVFMAVKDPTLLSAIAASRNTSIRVVPLVYDAEVFDKSAASAADREFVEALRQQGAIPTVMPTEGVNV